MKALNTIALSKDLLHLRKEGLSSGAFIGYEDMRDIYSVKKGGTTYINGISSHGKTIFLVNILVGLTKKYGWKHGIFSPETGTPTEVLAEIMHTYSGKRLREQDMSETEYYRYEAELADKFYAFDIGENDLTIDKFIKGAKEAILEHDLDTITLDPWNEFMHDFSKFSGREDKYLAYWLGSIRRLAKDTQTHIFIIAHPKEPQKNKDGKLQPPTFFDFAGGHVWSAKAMNVLCVYRPAEDWKGRPYPDHDQTDVYVQKVKPKEIGKKGMFSLFLDLETNRFKELNRFSDKVYPYE